MAIRWGSLAGAVSAVCYCVGDVLLLGGREDPERFALLRRDDVELDTGAMLPASYRRLRAGALLGLSAPLQLAAGHDQARAIGGKAGTVVGALLSVTHVLSPFMHGSFGPMGQAFKAAQEELESGGDPATVDALVAQGNSIKKALNVPYMVFFAAAGTASAIATERILRGKTSLPRWSAAVIPPALPIAAMSALTGTTPAKRTVLQPLQGAGMSLGLLVSFTAGALVRRHNR